MHFVDMKRAVKGVLILAAAFVASCIAVDEFSPKQRTQIERYLTSKNLEYTITSDSAYVHLAGNKFLAADEPRGEGATKGDRVTFNFEAYTFVSSPAQKPYYTNKRYLAEQLEGLNTTYWDFNPREITLGSGEILNSLNEALEGSLGGDSLAVFLTSNIAYQESGMGVVPANTPVMFVITVEQITK